MEEPKPIFKRENLLYEREEKEGYWTFISKIHPEAREIIVNPTTIEILLLCDGSRTLQMIENEMMNRYPNIDGKKIKIDIAKTIASFSRLGIVEWDGDNPFLFKKEEPISDVFSMMVAQEDDIRRLKEFIESFISHKFKNNRNYFSYITPYLDNKEYEEVALRQKLFSYIEEFFVLLRKSEWVGLISIGIPLLPNSTAATIKLILCPQNYFRNLLQYAHDNFPYLSVREITKIEISELVKKSLEPKLKEVLFEMGYKEEGIFRNELGFEKDVKVFSFYYERKFIEKINKIKEVGYENL